MFIGHFAPAMVAATHDKAPGLPVLLLAAQFVDWLFFAFLLTGTEAMRVTPGISAMNPMDLYHMPYTHSLLGSAVWALLFGGAVWLATRSRTGAVIAGAVVLSHWLLDLLVHIPDLTLVGQPPKLGLGLWNYPAIAMPMELGISFAALWFYARVRRPARLPLAVLAIVLVGLQMVNWFGPVATEIDAGTSFTAFFAFALITLAGGRAGRSEARKQAG